jgi:hypothetical protein
VAVFQQKGYEVCEGAHHERDFEKVAIYVDWFGVPTHAARQYFDGIWYSKIGRNVDITHVSLNLLEGGLYGIATVTLRRRWTLRRRLAALLLKIRTSHWATRCVGFW